MKRDRVAADPCPCGGLVNRERVRVADARLRDGWGDGEVLELPIAHGGSFRRLALLTARWCSLPKSRVGYSRTGRRCVGGTSETPANGWARGTKRESSRRSRRAGPSRRAWGRRARLGPPEAYRLQLATEDGEEAGVVVVAGDLGHERVGEDHAVGDGGVVLFENARARFPSGLAVRLLWSRRPWDFERAPGQEPRRSRHKWLEAERAAAGVAVPQKPSWVSKSGYPGRD